MRCICVSGINLASCGVNCSVTVRPSRNTIGVDTTAHGDEHVPESHARSRPKEESSSTESLGEKGCSDRDREVPDLQDTVLLIANQCSKSLITRQHVTHDQGLIEGRGDTDVVQYNIEVVGDRAVARPLAEEADS